MTYLKTHSIFTYRFPHPLIPRDHFEPKGTSEAPPKRQGLHIRQMVGYMTTALLGF